MELPTNLLNSLSTSSTTLNDTIKTSCANFFTSSVPNCFEITPLHSAALPAVRNFSELQGEPAVSFPENEIKFGNIVIHHDNEVSNPKPLLPKVEAVRRVYSTEEYHFIISAWENGINNHKIAEILGNII